MLTQYQLEKLKKAFKEREHIEPQLAWQMMRRANENNYSICFLWKIPNKTYEKWYKEIRPCYEGIKGTLEEETTYIVYSGEKAFDSSKGGYSIFARSIGDHLNKRDYTIDRIEGKPLEYAIDITDLMKDEE